MPIRGSSVRYDDIDDYILNEAIIDFQEYYLIKDNIIYKFIIYKKNKELIIKYRNYQISFDINNLQKLTKSYFNNIDDAFEFVTNLFEDNKVILGNINPKKEMKLKIVIFCYNKEKEVEITLSYNKDNNDLITKHINIIYEIIKSEIDNKKESKYLKETIDKNKTNINSSFVDISVMSLNEILLDLESEKFKNPSDIKFKKNVVNDSYAEFVLCNTFTVFKSIDNLIYLIYTNKNKSIITYDLEQNKIIKERVKAHNEYISNFRNYLDNINKRDLILSISCKDNNIKLWNLKNLELLTNINNINRKGELNSACFLNNNNQTFIISSSDVEEPDTPEPIKVFDLNGNNVKEIKNSKEITFFIDSFYDTTIRKNYIITSNVGYSKSYDFQENKEYQKYISDDDKRGRFSINIYNSKNKVKLIESSCDGNIRIFDFHNALLLKIIKISNNRIYGICLWNEDYLFAGCEDNNIKLIQLENSKIIKKLNGHKKDVINLKKIFIQPYGECLLSQGWMEGDIKIWCNP